MLSLARHSDKMLCILNDAEIKSMLKAEKKVFNARKCYCTFLIKIPLIDY